MSVQTMCLKSLIGTIIDSSPSTIEVEKMTKFCHKKANPIPLKYLLLLFAPFARFGDLFTILNIEEEFPFHQS
jgi:hypothetical protein